MPKQQNNQRPQQPKQSKGGKPIGSRILYIVYGVILLLLVFNLFGNDGAAKQQITWERLEPILERHDYESITVINQETAEIKIKDEAIKNDPKRYRDLEQPSRFGQPPATGVYTYNIGNFEHFDKELAVVESRTGHHISYKIENHSNSLEKLLLWFGPLLIMIVFFWLMSAYARKQMGGDGGGFGGMFGFGGSRAKQYDATRSTSPSRMSQASPVPRKR